MRRWLLLSACALAACAQHQEDEALVGPNAGTLPAAPMQVFASYEAFCGQLQNATCVGEWAGRAGGKSSLGAYRFIDVEYPNPKDGQGAVHEIQLEVATAAGVAYRVLGQTRAGKVSTSLMVKEVLEKPDALELKLVFRSAPRLRYSDYYSETVVVQGATGPAAVEVALGKLVGDIDTGRTTGTVGEAKWKSGKIQVKGATVADGVWTVAAQ